MAMVIITIEDDPNNSGACSIQITSDAPTEEGSALTASQKTGVEILEYVTNNYVHNVQKDIVH